MNPAKFFSANYLINPALNYIFQSQMFRRSILLCMINVSVLLAGLVVGRAQNLLTNGDFESGNTGFTVLNYTSVAGAIGSGNYSVRNNSTGAGGNFVTTLVDHTSGAGNMLLARRTATGTDYPWSQSVTTLTVGQKYSVSYWYIGGSLTSAATLQLYSNTGTTPSIVAGNTAGSLNTITSTSTWTQSAPVTFTATSSSYWFAIVDTNPAGGGGNTFGLDDISLTLLPVPEASTWVWGAVTAAFVFWALRRRMIGSVL
jgi:hypothetical protein